MTAICWAWKTSGQWDGGASIDGIGGGAIKVFQDAERLRCEVACSMVGSALEKALTRRWSASSLTWMLPGQRPWADGVLRKVVHESFRSFMRAPFGRAFSPEDIFREVIKSVVWGEHLLSLRNEGDLERVRT